MLQEKFILASKMDTTPLSVLMVSPDDGEPKGLVQFSHGMAEHKERYLRVMALLADAGYASIIHDHRGHGESVRASSDLGYFYDGGADGVTADLAQVNALLRQRYPDRKLVMVGHSMGSLAARAYAAERGDTLDGLLVSGSPGYNAACGAGKALTWVLQGLHLGNGRARSKLMDAMLNGPFEKNFKGDSHFLWLSANRDNVRQYEADPLCGFGFTLNGYRALLTLMQRAYDPKTRLPESLPVRFMSGEDDPCALGREGFDAAVANIRARGPKRVEAKMYPGLRHEIFNERSDEVDGDLLAFVEAVCGA